MLLAVRSDCKKLLQYHFPEKTIKANWLRWAQSMWLAQMDQVADEDYQEALVIVCDTANTARIDDQRYTTGDFLIKIDHHPDDEVYRRYFSGRYKL